MAYVLASRAESMRPCRRLIISPAGEMAGLTERFEFECAGDGGEGRVPLSGSTAQRILRDHLQPRTRGGRSPSGDVPRGSAPSL